MREQERERERERDEEIEDYGQKSKNILQIYMI